LLEIGGVCRRADHEQADGYATGNQSLEKRMFFLCSHYFANHIEPTGVMFCRNSASLSTPGMAAVFPEEK
jgi:hypothetical protein